MGPSAQFVLGVSDYNVDYCDPIFYNISDSREEEEEDDRSTPKESNSKPQSGFDGEGYNEHEAAIPHDDLDLLSLLGECVLSS
jgi:hypothetical protein